MTPAGPDRLPSGAGEPTPPTGPVRLPSDTGEPTPPTGPDRLRPDAGGPTSPTCRDRLSPDAGNPVAAEARERSSAGSPDGPARVLAAAVRLLPAGRRDWGRALQAELAAVTDPAERRSFARGGVRALAGPAHVLRGTLHLVTVVGTTGMLLAWAATVGDPPQTWTLYLMIVVLSAVCWTARRAGMLGPAGDGRPAGLLRAGGYLIAAGVVALAAGRAHPATLEEADAGAGVLVLGTVAVSFVVGTAVVTAKRSAATARVLVIGAGCGLAATAGWLVVVGVAPPIPPSTAGALISAAVAAVAAVAASAVSGTRSGTPAGRSAVTGGESGTPAGRSAVTGGESGTPAGRSAVTGEGSGTPTGRFATTGGRSGTARGRSGATGGRLLAGLLAAAVTTALVFVSVIVLAEWGPASLIPAITPHALPGHRVAESRIEIVDPYVLVLVVGAVLATVLGLAAVLTRRPPPAGARGPGTVTR
jgi:hypothetical protein